MKIISNAMGWILAQLSDLFSNNFAVSVLMFTILVNVLMLPLTLKTQKSTAKQAKLKPKLDALKKKYGDDKQKYNQAMSELYTKENVSMTGGCMPMVVRLLVMMGVYWAVISPLTYVLQLDTSAINSAKQWSIYVQVAEDKTITSNTWKSAGLETYMADSSVITQAETMGEPENVEFYAKLTIANKVNSMSDVDKNSEQNKIKSAIKSAKSKFREVNIVNYINAKNSDGSAKYPIVTYVYTQNGGELDKLNSVDFNLFGINLTETPDFSWNFSNFQRIWFIPIASFVAAMLSSIVSMGIQKKTNPDAPNMGFMMLMMPLFSLWIAFGVPGAVGFYWACSSIISGAIQALTQIFYGPNVVIAKEQASSIIARSKKEKAKMLKAASKDAE